jgi:DNA-binding GntR family transcriptional regulator
MEEHWAIYEAIKDRNPDLAEKLMRKHILEDGVAVSSQLDDYFKKEIKNFNNKN